MRRESSPEEQAYLEAEKKRYKEQEAKLHERYDGSTIQQASYEPEKRLQLFEDPVRQEAVLDLIRQHAGLTYIHTWVVLYREYGMSDQLVSKILKELQEKGLVQRGRKKIWQKGRIGYPFFPVRNQDDNEPWSPKYRYDLDPKPKSAFPASGAVFTGNRQQPVSRSVYEKPRTQRKIGGKPVVDAKIKIDNIL